MKETVKTQSRGNVVVVSGYHLERMLPAKPSCITQVTRIDHKTAQGLAADTLLYSINPNVPGLTGQVSSAFGVSLEPTHLELPKHRLSPGDKIVVAIPDTKNGRVQGLDYYLHEVLTAETEAS